MAIRQLDVDQLQSWLEGFKTSDGVFTVDMEQHIVHWSHSAEEILGHSAKEVLGRPCHEVMGGRDGRNYRFCRRDCPIMVNAQRGRTTPNYDLLTKSKEGAAVWINCSIMVLKGNHSNPPAVLHLVRDVTQRRHLEQRAQKATAALKQLLEEDSSGDVTNIDPSPIPFPKLTRREQEVLRLLAFGLKTGQIAESLGVSPITARNHITSLLAKLGVDNRLQAVLYASNHKLV